MKNASEYTGPFGELAKEIETNRARIDALEELFTTPPAPEVVTDDDGDDGEDADPDDDPKDAPKGSQNGDDDPKGW